MENPGHCRTMLIKVPYFRLNVVDNFRCCGKKKALIVVRCCRKKKALIVVMFSVLVMVLFLSVCMYFLFTIASLCRKSKVN